MFKDLQLASELNELLKDACRILGQAVTLVGDGRTTDKVRKEEYDFCAQRIGLVMGRELMEIFEEIYWQYPELTPPEWQPIHRREPEKIRENAQRKVSLGRDETLACLRLLWDVFRESKDGNVRASAERLRLQLPSTNDKAIKNTDAVEYYREVIGLLEARVDELVKSKPE